MNVSQILAFGVAAALVVCVAMVAGMLAYRAGHRDGRQHAATPTDLTAVADAVREASTPRHAADAPTQVLPKVPPIGPGRFR